MALHKAAMSRARSISGECSEPLEAGPAPARGPVWGAASRPSDERARLPRFRTVDVEYCADSSDGESDDEELRMISLECERRVRMISLECEVRVRDVAIEVSDDESEAEATDGVAAPSRFDPREEAAFRDVELRLERRLDVRTITLECEGSEDAPREVVLEFETRINGCRRVSPVAALE